jgi:hypothetical protein
MIEKEKALLNAAAILNGCDWKDLLSFRVTPEIVSIILPSGQKKTYKPDELREAFAKDLAEGPQAEAELPPDPEPEPKPRRRAAAGAKRGAKK